MSQIEETLSRISKMGGVEGYVITDGEGAVVRQSKSFSDEVAASYATEVNKLTKRARHLVRDLDPKVRQPAVRAHASAVFFGAPPCPTLTCQLFPTPHATPQNDLEFFRLRTGGSREILAAPGDNSLVIVVQVWRTASEAAAALAAAEAESKLAGGK